MQQARTSSMAHSWGSTGSIGFASELCTWTSAES